MRNDRLRVAYAIEQAQLICRFASRGREEFFGDLLVQSAILHRLALLGEACRGISPAFRDAHPDIPWRQIAALRNVVIQEYFGVDLELVWSIASNHAAALATQLEAVASPLGE